MKNEKLSSLFVLITLGMVAADSTNAQSTDLTIAIDQNLQANVTLSDAPSGSGLLTGEQIYLTAFQASYVSGAALPFPTSNPFITFCIDILPDLQGGNGGSQYLNSTWTAQSFPPNSANGNAIPYVNNGIQTAANLYQAYVGNIGFLSGGAFTGSGTISGDSTHTFYSGEQWGAALQLSIWTALYGSAFNATGVNPSVATLETAILASSYNTPNFSLTSTFWNATDPSDNQDLIGPQFQPGFAPEPGTYATVASGFAGLALLGVRRKQTRA